MSRSISKIIPAGHRVLVKPDPAEKTTESGIIIQYESKARVDQAQVTGTLVEIGPSAWKDYSDGAPWASVGDRVLFAKFGGYEVKIKGELYRVMNDEDITAVIEESNDE